MLDDGRSGKTYNNHLSDLRGFFGWCADERLIRENPADGIRTARYNRGQGMRAFTVEEMQALVRVARASSRRKDRRRSPDRAHAYALSALTGLRKGELFALEWGMWDGDGVLELPGAITKSGRDEVVFLEGEGPRVLADLRASRSGHGVSRFDQVFTGTVDNRQMFDDMADAGVLRVDERGRRAGWHSWRKGFLTMRARMGDSAAEIMKRGRHTRFDVSMQHYVDGTILQQQGRLDGLPSFFFENEQHDLTSTTGMDDSVGVKPSTHPSGQMNQDDGLRGAGPCDVSRASHSDTSSRVAPRRSSTDGEGAAHRTPGRDARSEYPRQDSNLTGTFGGVSVAQGDSHPHPSAPGRDAQSSSTAHTDAIAQVLEGFAVLLRARGAEGAFQHEDPHPPTDSRGSRSERRDSFGVAGRD